MTHLEGAGWSFVDAEQDQAERDLAARKSRALARGDLEALAEFQAEDEVLARGRRSGGIYGVKHDQSHVYRTRDGRVQAGVNWILSADRIEKVRQGYSCINCTEDFIENGLPTAWPEHCPVCGFPVRAEQAAQLERDIRADEHVGELESESETEGRWGWEKAENRWRRGGAHKGILIPRGVRL